MKSGTTDSNKDWFAVGDYKRLANEVGGNDTCPPKDVHREIKNLLSDYNSVDMNGASHPTFPDLVNHRRFDQFYID